MSVLQDRIKEQRAISGLTLMQISVLLGVQEATVQRYESGEIKNIKHDTILDLSKIFRCDPAYLMGWTDDPSPYKNCIQEYNNNNISAHEKTVIVAYRSKPEMQPAVDKLLGIDDQPKIYKVAARSVDNHPAFEELTPEEAERLRNAPHEELPF